MNSDGHDIMFDLQDYITIKLSLASITHPIRAKKASLKPAIKKEVLHPSGCYALT